MYVMVTGGSGRREEDRRLAAGVLNQLFEDFRVTGLVPSTSYAGNDAASEWWKRRLFGRPAWVNETPDVVVILPGVCFMEHVRAGLRRQQFLILVDETGRYTYLDGRRSFMTMAGGVA